MEPTQRPSDFCPTCQRPVDSLQYHIRLTHQATTLVHYESGPATLHRRPDDQHFHCLHCGFHRPDPTKLQLHARTCTPKPTLSSTALPPFRNSEYLFLPDHNMVVEYSEHDLPSLGIAVNTLLRVVICLECKKTIPLSSLASHVKQHVKYLDVPCGLSAKLCESFGLQDDIVWPKTAIEPVYPLPIQETPFIFCDACNLGYSDIDSLSAHRRRSHQADSRAVTAPGVSHRGYAQQIHYRKTYAYLEVIVDNLVKKVDRPLDYPSLFMENLPKPRDHSNLPLRSPDNDMTVTSFYLRDGWLKHLHGFTPVDLREASRNSTAQDEGADILRKLAHGYLKPVEKNLIDHGGLGLEGALGTVVENLRTDEQRHRFAPLQPGSIEKYSLLLHRLVFNWMRFHSDDAWESSYRFPPIDDSQYQAIQDLRSMIRQRLAREAGVTDPEELHAIAEEYSAPLSQLYHRLCYKLFAHTKTDYRVTSGLDKFFSAVNCYAAILVVHESGATRKYSETSQTLVTFMYCIRTCMFTEYIDLRTTQNLTLDQALARIQPYLIDRRETPMSFLFNAMALLNRLKGNEVMDSDFVFSDPNGMEVSYRGHRITVNHIKDMVNGTLETYHSKLKETAFFGEDFPSELFPEIAIEDLVDNPSNRTPGYSFLDDPRNGFDQYRGAYGRWLLSDPERAEKFTRFDGKKLVWKREPCVKLLQDLETCREHLMVGLVISAGPASRGSEIARQILRESPGRPRNVLILFQILCLTGIIDKTTGKFLILKYVPHVAIREFALALILYLIFIREFEEMLVESLFASDEDLVFRYRHDLWPSLQRPITGDDMSNTLGRVMHQYLGHTYKITFWRKLVTQFASFFRDKYLYEIHKEFFVDTASMHSSEVAFNHYTAPGAGLPTADTRSIVGCIRVGLAWHKLVNIGQSKPIRLPQVQHDEPVTTTATPANAAIAISDQVVAQLAGAVLRELEPAVAGKLTDVVKQLFVEVLNKFWPKPPISSNSSTLRPVSDVIVHPSRRRDLREFLRSPDGKFTCPEQGILLEYILEGKDNILGILGTSFGKTTLIMMMARMYGRGKVTVVMLPLSSLHPDLEQRAKKYGLVVSKWDPDPTKYNPYADIVTCAVEALHLPSFQVYLQNLEATDLLFRLIFDEIHKVITDVNFREAFNFFWVLNLAKTQIVGLTASFPPHLFRDFSILTKTTWKTLRMPSSRKELIYDIVRLGHNSEPQMVKAVHAYLQERFPAYSDTDRAIVFCRSVKAATEMAKALEINPYIAHNNDPVQEAQNVETMALWRQGQYRTMVSTSILGCGLDYPSIRHVIHLDIAFSVMDQYQEDSRGGRDGLPCHAVTFVYKHSKPRSNDHPRYRIGVEEQYEWVASDNQCYRIIPTNFLDAAPVTCMLLDGAELCGFCRRQEFEDPPDHPVHLPMPGPDVSTLRVRSDWNEISQPTPKRGPDPLTTNRWGPVARQAQTPLPQTPNARNPFVAPPPKYQPHTPQSITRGRQVLPLVPSSSPLLKGPVKNHDPFSTHVHAKSRLDPIDDRSSKKRRIEDPIHTVPSMTQSSWTEDDLSPHDDIYCDEEQPSYNHASSSSPPMMETPTRRLSSTSSMTSDRPASPLPSRKIVHVSSYKPPPRANVGIGVMMSNLEANSTKNEWERTVQLLQSILLFFRGKCILCFVRGQTSWNHHESDRCPLSNQLKATNPDLKAFRESVRFEKDAGICYGCHLPLNFLHDSRRIGMSCLDLGTSARICYLYHSSLAAEDPCPHFDPHTDGQFSTWLTQAVDEPHRHGSKDLKRHYNVWDFLMWFAAEFNVPT